MAQRELAPQLRGETLGGETVDFANFARKVVVLNVWSSSCGPCRAEARSLNSVCAATQGLGVVFVGLDIRDGRTSAIAFQRSKSVPYESIFDPDGEQLLRLRGDAPQAPPATLIYDRAGRLALTHIGVIREAQLLSAVQQIAAEKRHT